MSRKTTPSRSKGSSSTKRTAKAKSAGSRGTGAQPKKVARRKKTTGSSTARTPKAKPAQKRPRSSRAAVSVPSSPIDLLAKAEADMAAVVESLNSQMSSALNAMTELAVSQRGRGAAVVRTAPLDRATATFQRLVAEVLDDHLSEMLPPLIALRNELAQNLSAPPGGDGADSDLHQRGVAMLDQVLAMARVQTYDARPGEAFDSLIHLAVGQTHRSDLNEGVVAESVQPGFRSSRGKVIAPARVKVNRR